ncbi:MAG TPA: efflux RND transporter periplasmic adaptor subunit, partial [Verrucomicrobiae bacterium]|nr:efflux RND transporter periplasmic adaptor subunit [Verrucomicrobiae bacterium]
MAKQRSGGKFKWLVLLCVLAGAAAGGAWYFKRGADDSPQYQITPVVRGDLTQIVTATGTLNP